VASRADWLTRREQIWTPHDPDRLCYGCGARPTGRFPDGSPQYLGHSHPVVTATAEQVERWAAQRPVVALDDDDVEQVEQHVDDVMAAAERHALANRWAFESADAERVSKRRGYAAELAVARHLGLPWRRVVYTGRRGVKPADVGENVEVRTWRGRGLFFPVKDGDPDSRLVVLADGDIPIFRLLGWAIIGPLKLKKYRHDDRHRHPYWRVPQRELALFPIPPGLAK
jgi:hypothetical protein